MNTIINILQRQEGAITQTSSRHRSGDIKQNETTSLLVVKCHVSIKSVQS